LNQHTSGVSTKFLGKMQSRADDADVADTFVETLAVPSIDPAQPPADPLWAEAWLRLSRIRLRQGKAEVALSAAQLACQLQPALEQEASDIINNVKKERFHQVTLNGFAGSATLILDECHERPSVSELTGAIVWSAGKMIARAFTRFVNLSGRHLLELGSGTGVAGLAAALCGANVVLTDLPAAMALLEENVSRNHSSVLQAGGSVSTRSLDYRHDMISPDLKAVDLVFGTDLVWMREQCEPLARWCMRLGRPVMLAHAKRNPQTEEALLAAFEAAGFVRKALPHVSANWGVPIDVFLFLTPGEADPRIAVPWLSCGSDIDDVMLKEILQ